MLSSDPLFWLLAIIGVIFTGISKSGLAGGAGVVAVPLLALVISIPEAAALMLPLLLIMDVRTISLYRHAIKNYRSIATIVIAGLLGVVIAGSAMGSLPTESLQLILAILCISFALWDQLAPILTKLPGSAMIWGTFAGITSTLLHAGGPPISIYFLAQKLEKQQWLGQAAIFFAMINFSKLVPYTLNNSWSTELLLTSVVLIPFALIGVSLGYRIQKLISQDNFMRMCRGMLLISGVSLLVKL